MQKRWLIKDASNKETVKKLQHDLNVSEIISEMLVHRGITNFEEAETFFNPSLDSLHDPFLMKDMEHAVKRINNAIEQEHKILIYGDYDVDGTTAVSLFYGMLFAKYDKCAYYIPDRYLEGYGVSEKGIQYAIDNDFPLIITLDCGVKAVEMADLAKKGGVDMIICDHHTPGETLPDAIVLDPKRKDCNYPYDELSGCGVGFKLLQALWMTNNWDSEELLKQLDLLAISIGADIVPITGENRTLAFYGMKQVNDSPRIGVSAMLNVAKKKAPLTLTDVVFTIAPRINAAGRMGDAKTAVRLLLSDNLTEATSIAQEIQSANDERRNIDEEIKDEALVLLEDSIEKLPFSNIVFKKGWHKGVIGIVASRLIEHRYRPTVVLTQIEENGLLTGSVRSIDGVNVYDVLESCSPVLEQFGGHYFAAGLSLKEENLEKFIQLFNEKVGEIVTDEMLVPEQLLEAEVNFHDLFLKNESLYEVPRFKRILSRFEPHGPGNMKPVFLTKNVYIKDARLLKDQHLKLRLFQPGYSNCIMDAIAFFRPDAYDFCTSGEPIDLVYTLETNEWNGKTTLQLNIKDLRPALMVV
jgi:single-stranded-DNA-specific exonuclease